MAHQSKLITDIDTLKISLSAGLTERDSLVSERDALVSERDSLVSQRDALVSERDSLISERDSLVSERDALVSERDALVSERDSLVSERNSLTPKRTAHLSSHLHVHPVGFVRAYDSRSHETAAINLRQHSLQHPPQHLRPRDALSIPYAGDWNSSVSWMGPGIGQFKRSDKSHSPGVVDSAPAPATRPGAPFLLAEIPAPATRPGAPFLLTSAALQSQY